MHEDDFRRRLRDALGTIPDEDGAVDRAVDSLRGRQGADERHPHPRAAAVVAAALTVLVVAGLLWARAIRSSPPDGRSLPAAVPDRAKAPPIAPLDVSSCRLPVIVSDSRAEASAPPADARTNYPTGLEHTTAGFYSVATGRFDPDPAAQGAGMPFDRMYVNDTWRPQLYDPVIRRWLPVDAGAVSPDHHSYIYVVYSPLGIGKGNPPYTSSTLHRYDVMTGQDRALWTFAGSFTATWAADGIHVQAVPVGGGQLSYWLVDPVSGSAGPDTNEAPAGKGASANMQAYNVGRGGSFGTDAQGRPIILDGTRDPGSPQVYFVGGPNGQRIIIHQGVMGDRFDFDPNGFSPDGDRLWTANMDATAIWLWTESGGLQKLPLSGVPTHDMYVQPRVAGGCV